MAFSGFKDGETRTLYIGGAKVNKLARKGSAVSSNSDLTSSFLPHLFLVQLLLKTYT